MVLHHHQLALSCEKLRPKNSKVSCDAPADSVQYQIQMAAEVTFETSYTMKQAAKKEIP